MEPTCWGDYPIDTSLYYNNDREIGLALNRLLKHQTQDRLLFLDSKSPAVADGVSMHLARILCQLRETPLDVFWFAGYPDSDFNDLGISLRRLLLELWKAQDFKLMSKSELAALSFEISGCRTPEEYFQLNIAALSARNNKSDIFIVLDLQEVKATLARQQIVKLAEIFLESPVAAWRRGIVIRNASAGDDLAIRLSAPPHEIDALLTRARNVGEFSESTETEDHNFSGAARFIHPLIALNQPAQRTVLDYILNHSPNIEQEIQQLLKTSALWKLGNDRVRLSPAALRADWNTQSHMPIAFTDTIPNGAKILSFQSIDRLIPQVSGLREIENTYSDATKLVDLFAMAVGQKHSNDRGYLDTLNILAHELKQSRNPHTAAGDKTSQSLLYYSSQLLLTHAAEFGVLFFRLLEGLTFSYADFIRLQYGATDSRMYEASRWLTNLGYLYDKIESHVGRVAISNRESIFAGAANYLSRLNPDEIRAWSEIRYSEAWQLWDAGQKHESVDKFVYAARRLRQFIRTEPLPEQTLNVVAQEMFVLAFALMPKRRVDVDVREFIEKLLENYSSRLSFLDLVTGFTGDAILLDAADHQADPLDDVVIVACYFDLHIALLAAQVLRRQFRRATKVVLIPGVGDHDPQRYLRGHLNLVIGAPDTPGSIGRFVSACDPELVRLYQLRLFGKFGAAVECDVSGHHFHLLTACGLAGNLSAWQTFVERNASTLSNEVSPMDEIIRQLLLPPIIAAETKIVSVFIDRLLSKLGRKRDESKLALEQLRTTSPEKLESAIGKLDGDVKSALVDVSNGASIAQALDEAMEILRSKELDLNQLLSLATLAYEYATRLQRTFSPASNQEKKIGVFVASFRDQRSNADILRQEFLALPTSDHRRLNSAAETLAQSLRNFRLLAAETS